MGASRPITFQSLAYSWAASSSIFVDLSFLNPARAMRNPVIYGMRIRANLTGTTGTSGAPARIFPQNLTQIRVSDIAGDRVNVRGSSLRVIDQVEYGVGFSDCSPSLTIGASAGATSYEHYLRIPFRPIRAERRDDFGMPLREFLDGGQIQLVTGPALIATNFLTTTTGTYTVYVDVVDEGVSEAKSRICWFDQSISKTEDQYNVSGLARFLLAYNGEINERVSTQNPNAWSSQTITSKTLELSQVQDTWFRDYYKQESFPRIQDPGNVATASVVTTEDAVVQGQAVPVLLADLDESTATLPQMSTFHYKTSLGSITTTDLPQIIVCAITERSDAATARTLGADWRSKLGRAYVGASDGNHAPITRFSPAVQKFLPLRLM